MEPRRLTDHSSFTKGLAAQWPGEFGLDEFMATATALAVTSPPTLRQYSWHFLRATSCLIQPPDRTAFVTCQVVCGAYDFFGVAAFQCFVGEAFLK